MTEAEIAEIFPHGVPAHLHLTDSGILGDPHFTVPYPLPTHLDFADWNTGDTIRDLLNRIFVSPDCGAIYKSGPLLNKAGEVIPGRTLYTITIMGSIDGDYAETTAKMKAMLAETRSPESL